MFASPANQSAHNVFDVSLPIEDELIPFVNWVASLPPGQRPKTAAYPMADDPFADPPVQLAQQKLQALGVKTVYSKIFPAENASYKPAADQVAATGAQAVVLGSTDVPTVSAFMQAFEQQHYNPKMFICAAGPDQGAAFTSAVGKGNATGMMVPNGWYPGYANPASQKMVNEYVAKYGGSPSDVNADVAEAYSVGQVMAQAVTGTKGTDNAEDHHLPAQRRDAQHRPGTGEVRQLRQELQRRGVHLPVAAAGHRVQAGPPGQREPARWLSSTPSRTGPASPMARQIYQAIVDGILVGGVYALMAVGLTLIFGVLDIINIAQGVLVILGAYLSYSLSVRLHLDLFLGLLITVPAMFVIGVVIQWAFIRRLRGRERTSMTLLVTYAVALIIEGILYEIYGPNPKQLNASYVQSSVHVFGFYLSYIYLYGFALALALVAAIYALLYRTRFGRSVRATMQDETAARLIGIDVNRVAALTFGVGVAVTAAGGMMFGATNAFNPNSGYDLISRLLAIIILGGLGSIGGALVASVFMLTLESLVTIWSPEWAIVVFYAALVLVLLIRPTGFFGRQPVRAQ